MTPLRTRFAALCCAAAIALPGAAWAQDDASAGGDDAETPNPIVATVNGEEIRYQEVLESAKQLPPQYQQQIDRIFPALVDRMVDLELLADAAADAGLEDDPQVKERMAELRKEVVRNVFLERFVDEEVTEARLKEAYEDYLEENPPRPEIKARHILLETQEGAKEVIEELDGGADFVELAKEKSIGPSGSQGGDLGFFGQGQMVEPFEEAAFALEPGSYTEEPVETQFGWHVIKVEERREVAPESFEEMREQLRQGIARTVVEEYLAGLREDAEVEILIDQPAAGDGMESEGDSAGESQ